MRMLDLANPTLDWVQVANCMGVEAARAKTMEKCADPMAASFGRKGPFWIELVI
jgi:acetolactate synthase-1/2/3 large subunit